jgi:hypothetical protein
MAKKEQLLRFNGSNIEIKHKGKWITALEFSVKEADIEPEFAFAPSFEVLIPKEKRNE